MMVLVTYDVATSDRAGQRRLSRVAKTCLDYGQRVQYSVFECTVTPAEWVEFRKRLEDEIDPTEDSLRFYFLGKNWHRRVEHVGSKPSVDLDGPLIA
ncbi:MAG: CRISPR-associated endonuclease Cas2 [Pirellulales bacterium]